MGLIFETQNFVIEAAEAPLVSREEGGHITITPKVRVDNLTLLSPPLAIEQMYLTMLVGEAMTTGLKLRGIDIGRINYQDNGNWGVFREEGPYLHVHLYGRAKSATIHKYGEACYFPLRETGFYKNFLPLNEGDIMEVQEQINQLLKMEKYQLSNWKISL